MMERFGDVSFKQQKYMSIFNEHMKRLTPNEWIESEHKQPYGIIYFW